MKKSSKIEEVKSAAKERNVDELVKMASRVDPKEALPLYEEFYENEMNRSVFVHNFVERFGDRRGSTVQARLKNRAGLHTFQLNEFSSANRK
ncbi:hypothetical protein ECANGB1_548 [Enterospora canceri]|uniref:Uncharacterized protein n=1 Tax=Enterospora canceri TaxID=1081671 RepID=A0A1Y1S7Y7_9MICR|nr:hypothetical protein ECANGB1_548 [Enterospora canceri]